MQIVLGTHHPLLEQKRWLSGFESASANGEGDLLEALKISDLTLKPSLWEKANHLKGTKKICEERKLERR